MDLSEKLAEERRGRLAAERLLELKQAELYAANRKLGQHARALTEEIVETRAQVETIRSENEKVKSDLTVATQNLEVAQRRLWHSITTIQDGFAFFDNDDTLIAANTSYLSAFDGLEEVKPGVAYARILQLLSEEGIVDTGDLSLADWRSKMLRLRQSNVPEPVVVRLWNDHFIRVIEHRSSSGDLVSMAIDITESIQYERELEAARVKAEASARAKSSFLANMSHEIRTPMNGVLGMAELLQDSNLNDEQELYVDTIRNSAEALLVIINDILDYSKIDAEKMVLQNAPFDLEKSIHEVLMLLNHAAHSKGVSLLIDYDIFLTRNFVGDVGRIRQVLTNLIGNAVKFTLEGHVLVRITGIPDASGDGCLLHVAIEDTGIGIPADKVDHVFGEFTQVDDERNRQFEGTGLGLAISKRLVTLMGGDIWVTSEENVGSCFGFRIPLKIAKDAAYAPAPLPATLKQVMILDDTQTNLDILKRQLLALGVQATGFVNAEEALDHLDTSYDLVITDQSMPDMTGVEFIAKLRAQGLNTPTIILSSNPSELGSAVTEHNISAVLQRPLLRDKLLSTLRSLGAEIEEQSTAVATTPEPDDVPPEAPEEPAAPPAFFRARRRKPEPVVHEAELEPLPQEKEVAPEAAPVPEPGAEVQEQPLELIEQDEAETALSDLPQDAPELAAPAPVEDLAELDPLPEPTELAAPETDLSDLPLDEPIPTAPAPVEDLAELDPISTPPETVAIEPAQETNLVDLEPELPAAELEITTNEQVPPSVPDERQAQAEALAPLVEIELANTVQEPELATPDITPTIPDPIETLAQEPPEEEAPRLMRVLTAEDNKTNQLVLRKMLKTLEIDLQFANDGIAAVEAYQELKPDLIFMDISMPRMDGKEATSKIRELEFDELKRTPIIALTAHALTGDDQTILQAGLDSYLTKPFNKGKIIDAIVENAPENAIPPVSPVAQAG